MDIGTFCNYEGFEFWEIWALVPDVREKLVLSVSLKKKELWMRCYVSPTK